MPQHPYSLVEVLICIYCGFNAREENGEPLFFIVGPEQGTLPTEPFVTCPECHKTMDFEWTGSQMVPPKKKKKKKGHK